MKKSNKLLCGALLAAALISGMAVGGTYAYYAAQAEFNVTAQAKKFSVSVDATEIANAEYEVVNVGTLAFGDIAPGSSVEKTFTVKNNSEVDIDCTYAVVDLKAGDAAVDASVTLTLSKTSETLAAGAESSTITATLAWAKGAAGAGNDYGIAEVNFTAKVQVKVEQHFAA